MFDVVVKLKGGDKIIKGLCMREANRKRIAYRRNKVEATLRPSK